VTQTTRINIGCGQTPTQGWRNFDNSFSLRLARIPRLLVKVLHRVRLVNASQYQFILFARANQIEYGDATKGLPLSDGTVDVMYCSHMLEHLDQEEAKLFLKEAKRVLRSGGIIRLVVPDLRRQAQQYIESGDADAFVSATLLTRPQPRTIAERLEILLVGARQHQWMYDGRSLCRLLLAQGFENAVALEPSVTRIQSPGVPNLQERPSESVYVEAVRPGG
jgi:predicted SAM-dependent methyltransferase